MAANGISRKQERFLSQLLIGQSIADAARQSDTALRTAHRWLNNPAFVAERERRETALREAEEAEIAKIMSTGYAAVHVRIEALSKMADLIKLSFVATDENGKEKLEFKWVTPEKIKEFRGCLDDIAKELGHRVAKKEITGKDGGPIEFTTEWGGGALENEDMEA